jgi:preprotein translocase subunit SecD
MTICGQHRKHHLHFHTVLVLTVLVFVFTTALTAAGVSQTGKPKFEARLASHQKVEGWERVPGPEPEKTPIWVSPEVALNNSDLARAWPDRTAEGKPCVSVLLTEDGALKFARLTKSHIGEFLAVILDGRVTIAPKIKQEITGGEVMIFGNFTEKETGSIATGLSGIQIQTREPEVEPRKLNLELRLASHEKVEGWQRVPGPEAQNIPLWLSPEVAISNRDIARAYVERTPEGKPGVGIVLTEEGALKLARLTKSRIGALLAIILDGSVTSTPKIMDEITGGQAQIHGNFTEEEAQSLAKGIMLK